MDKLFQLIGDVSHVKLGGADTYTDQLNCRYTVFVLSLFAFIAPARVYVDEPISCFCPAEFEASHVAFAKKVMHAPGASIPPKTSGANSPPISSAMALLWS